MHMKSTYSADGAKGIAGSVRRHMGSRLHKACIYAEKLANLLKHREVTKAGMEAILEARAYHMSLFGANNFEKQSWERCLHGYSEARLIYCSLARSKGLQGSKEEDIFRDLLNTTIDPSIRYAAYQKQFPRTTSIDTIVSRFISHTDNEFIEEILKQNPEALDNPAATQKRTPSGTIGNVPSTIQWRSRTVSLEDAATAQALAAVSAAKENLFSFLSSNPEASPQAKGVAYDQVLIPSQDAVDATKTAIDELSAEGVSQSDRRMQSLQITRTAVNYALVEWRVGRNRVLCGKQDGAVLEDEVPKAHMKSLKDGKPRTMQAESNGRKLSRLKEKVVLHDSTLQSLDSVKELPGVAADRNFNEELQAKRAYFAALRCLTIARSHSLLQKRRNVLALLSRALDLSSGVLQNILSSAEEPEGAPSLNVTFAQAEALQRLLEGLVCQQRALVELHDLDGSESNHSVSGRMPPLVEKLKDYPRSPVDLTNLVIYPPRVEAIPVKPIFLDVAFNYIEYPGRGHRVTEKTVNGLIDGQANKEEKKEGRKGWFGFGR